MLLTPLSMNRISCACGTARSTPVSLSVDARTSCTVVTGALLRSVVVAVLSTALALASRVWVASVSAAPSNMKRCSRARGRGPWRTSLRAWRRGMSGFRAWIWMFLDLLMGMLLLLAAGEGWRATSGYRGGTIAAAMSSGGVICTRPLMPATSSGKRPSMAAATLTDWLTGSTRAPMRMNLAG